MHVWSSSLLSTSSGERLGCSPSGSLWLLSKSGALSNTAEYDPAWFMDSCKDPIVFDHKWNIGNYSCWTHSAKLRSNTHTFSPTHAVAPSNPQISSQITVELFTLSIAKSFRLGYANELWVFVFEMELENAQVGVKMEPQSVPGFPFVHEI